MSSKYFSIKSFRLIIYEDVTVVKCTRLFLSEFFGTAILIFLGCMSDVLLESKLQIALAFGLATMVSIETFVHISGANINPAISIALFLVGHNALADLPLYIVAQLIGGIAGHGLMLLILSTQDEEKYKQQRGSSTCNPVKNKYIGDFPACICEFLLTFLWVIAIAAAYDWRNKNRLDALSARIGLVVTALVLAGYSISGACMNPARILASSLNNREFESFYWIYYVGPLIAGVVGALFYRLFFGVPEPEEET